MPIINDAIRVGIQAGRGIIVHARGNPARIVAIGTAAAIVAIGAATAYYVTTQSRNLIQGRRRNNRRRNALIRRR
jgi:hypothetical protein